jgi:hypothetical protein
MKYLLIFLAFIIVANSYAKEFSISTNIGYSFPLGNFKDNSNIYSNCKKDYPYINIENTSMNNNFYYDFSVSYNISKDLKLNAIINTISNKIAGIIVPTFKKDVNTLQLIPNSTSPEFNSTNFSIGIEYDFLRFDELTFFCGLEPSIGFINYNVYNIYPAIPIPYVIEDKISKTCFGISGITGVERSITKDLSIIFSCKYTTIFTDYNHRALDIAYTCIPLNDYYTNPKYFITNIGIRYTIF